MRHLRTFFGLIAALLATTAFVVPGILQTSASATPKPIVVIVLENHYADHNDGSHGLYANVNAPFLNSIVGNRCTHYNAAGTKCTPGNYTQDNSCSTTSPSVCGAGYLNFYDYTSAHSLPNHMTMTSGYSQIPNHSIAGYACQSDVTTIPTGTPTSGSCWMFHQDQASIFSQLYENTTSYHSRLYQESMATTCALANDATNYLYVVRHNPGLFYGYIDGGGVNHSNLGGTTGGQSCDGSNGTAIDVKLHDPLPVLQPFTFVTPNVCDDMHGLAIDTVPASAFYIDGTTCTTADADAVKVNEADLWLKYWVPAFQTAGANVIITADEGTSLTCDSGAERCGDQVLTLVTNSNATSASVDVTTPFGDGTYVGPSPGTDTQNGFCNLLAGIEDHFSVGRLGCAGSLPSGQQPVTVP